MYKETKNLILFFFLFSLSIHMLIKSSQNYNHASATAIGNTVSVVSVHPWCQEQQGFFLHHARTYVRAYNEKGGGD